MPVSHPALKQVSPHSEVLNLVSNNLPRSEIKSQEIQNLIDAMLDMARGIQGGKKRRTMVGLAAPQVGHNKRIIIVDVAATGLGDETSDFRVYINPTIVKKSDRKIDGREGCFSTGNVCGIVARHQSIMLQALNRHGAKVTEDYQDFVARIIQHEIDHLDGVRFPDHVTDDTKLHWVEPDQFGNYRINWRNWPHLCSQEKWQSIKAGIAND